MAFPIESMSAQLRFPARCACCFRPSTDRGKIISGLGASVRVPFCLDCIEHTEVHKDGGTRADALGCLSFVVSALLLFGGGGLGDALGGLADPTRAHQGVFIALGFATGTVAAILLFIKVIRGKVPYKGRLLPREVAAERMLHPSCLCVDSSSATVKSVQVAAGHSVFVMTFRGTYAEDIIQMNPSDARWEVLPLHRKAIVAEVTSSVHDMQVREMAHWLGQLCRAYTENSKGEIEDLEPLATEIGRELDSRGGLNAMRQAWEILGNRPGARTLDMHWRGIGGWRG
jgi:hypothetical protein